MYSKSIDFITNSISSSQFDFLPKRYALQQLLIMTDFIYMAFNCYNHVACLYLDFRKAFDSISHRSDFGKWASLAVFGSGSVLT